MVLSRSFSNTFFNSFDITSTKPGVASSVVKLHDGTGTGGSLQFQAKFGTEGLDIYVPGNGIRFETSVHATISGTGSVTLGYTG